MEGAFRWADGTYPMWSAFHGQEPTGWKQKNYAELESTESWVWQVTKAHYANRFICELARNESRKDNMLFLHCIVLSNPHPINM